MRNSNCNRIRNPDWRSNAVRNQKPIYGIKWSNVRTQVITFEYNRWNANEHLMMNDELRTESCCLEAAVYRHSPLIVDLWPMETYSFIQTHKSNGKKDTNHAHRHKQQQFANNNFQWFERISLIYRCGSVCGQKSSQKIINEIKITSELSSSNRFSCAITNRNGFKRWNQ